MKKKLFLGLLAAAAVSFTACQKDEVLNEVQQDNAIGFGTYVGRDAQTKASVIDEIALGTKGLGVFAYYTGSNNYADTYKPEFMYNEKVYVEGSNWEYDNIKYWPGNSEKVSFFAYAPYVENANEIITKLPDKNTNGDPTIDFAVPETVSSQIDLLYATPVTDKSSGDVDLTFNHALSRIGFKAATARDDFKVTIKKIVVSGEFNTTGTLNLATSGEENGKWTVLSNEGSISYTVTTFNTTANNLCDTEAQPISTADGYLMVLPTEFKESNKITVAVTYDYTYYGTTETSKEQTGSISNLTLEKGRAYTFVLTLNPTNYLTPITFDVEVNPWNPTDGDDVNVE